MLFAQHFHAAEEAEMAYTYPTGQVLPSEWEISEALAGVMRSVYLWMCLGLLVTAGVGWSCRCAGSSQPS